MKAHNIFKSILALSLAVASVTSCQEKINGGGSFTKGEAVKFSVGTEGSGTDTKAVYAGNTTTPGEKERINWEPGDQIRIWCDAVSEPTSKYADYSVTSVEASGAKSKAHIECAGGVGLRWGTGDHYFYAVYPSPASGGIATVINGKTVSGNLTSDDQGNNGMTETSSGSGSYVVKPDLKWMMMTAKAGPYSETGAHAGADGVFLSFTPLTTAIEFTIYNGNKNAALDVNKIMLISETTQISGTFTVDLDTVEGGYAKCTGTASDSKQVCIDFSSLGISLAQATGDGTANCKSLKFTFFLAPTTDVSDLTFKLYKNASDWMSTKLGYTDGSGVWFPCHKKSSVTGLIVPEGAQWTVKYAPDVKPWIQNGSNIGPMPELGVDPFVTSWDTGIDEDLALKPIDPFNGHEYVDLGLPSGTLWATCNVGATKPEEYGEYFAWGEVKGHIPSGDSFTSDFESFDHSDARYTGPWNASKCFTWVNTPYQTQNPTGYSDTRYTKYLGNTSSTYKDPSATDSDALKTVLDLKDDAAHVNWGGSWRMPTKAEFDELIANTDHAWVSDYEGGVSGLIFTSKTNSSKSIFLPAAGVGNDKNLDDINSSGFYLSSSLFASNPSKASIITIFSKGGPQASEGGEARFSGQSVRPVAKK